MRRHHPKNERIKRRYSHYLEEAQRLNVKSVDQALAAIAQFEASTGVKDFAAFHIEQARRFKHQLETDADTKTGKPLAKATITSRLKAVQRFFVWLAGQPGYKSKITYSDADYFNPSFRDECIATAKREQPVPSIEQVRHVLNTMPAGTDIEKRDRALVAFALLSGGRDDALASLSLKHIDTARKHVHFDARDVRTKNRKTFPTWFFPVGGDIETIVLDWIDHLKTALLFGPDDPLFPKTRIAPNAERRFAPAGLDRAHWSNADPVRRIFRQAFESAGLPYFNPHSFRKTLASLGEKLCGSPEEFKAWSQNLGHDNVMTTFMSYGAVAAHRQEELIDKLRSGGIDGAILGKPSSETIGLVLHYLARQSSFTRENGS